MGWDFACTPIMRPDLRATRRELSVRYPIEVIVSDNADDDDKAEELQALSTDRFHYLRSAASNALGNWNHALKHAGGKFACFLSDDDLLIALPGFDSGGFDAPADAAGIRPTMALYTEQAGIYGGGKVAMVIGLPWEVATAAKSNPQIKELTGAFPIPSKDAGKNAPVFQGGSNLAVPATAKDQDLARDYLKLMTSSKYQTEFAKAGMIPGTSSDVSALEADPVNAAMAEASKSGKSVPATPGWAAIEAGQNPIKDMMTAYLTGAKDFATAAGDANTALNKAFAG